MTTGEEAETFIGMDYAALGRKPYEAMVLLAKSVGVSPIPKDPEAMGEAIRLVFLREEGERDQAFSELQDLYVQAGGFGEATIKEMAAHIRDAIEV